MSNATIDAEQVETTAVAVRGPLAVGKAMSVNELKESLAFVKQVMREVMVEGQDYGKIPGCGEKPALLQPGAQKLCMTFRFNDRVKKEEVRPIQHSIPGHREYELTVILEAPNGRQWEGVGTCSTMETKYRYRSSNRKCPQCGKETIIKGKAEYGGGWLCFGKRGGCGTKWPDGAKEIESQSADRVEYENPADYWNTVRKMAFKRALVHASINATNTSELWTQDIDDMSPSGEPEAKITPKHPQAESKAPTPQPAPKSSAPVKPEAKTLTSDDYIRILNDPNAANLAGYKEAVAFADRCRAKFINHLGSIDEAAKAIAWSLFIEFGNILPSEGLWDIPVRHVPMTTEVFSNIVNEIKDRLESMSESDINRLVEEYSQLKDEPPKAVGKPITVPRDEDDGPPTTSAVSEAWHRVIVPVPRKGMKRDEYLKHPDTIGSLFDQRHGADDDSAAARQRLWGFVNNYDPKGWTNNQGRQMPPSAGDVKFREALDEFADWFARNHPDEKL